MREYGLNEGHKKKKKQHTEYAANHKSHEACFYRKTAESQKQSRADESIFYLYVSDCYLNAGKIRYRKSSLFEKALFEYVETKYPEIPEAIRTEKVMSEEIEAKLITAIEECKKAEGFVKKSTK